MICVPEVQLPVSGEGRAILAVRVEDTIEEVDSSRDHLDQSLGVADSMKYRNLSDGSISAVSSTVSSMARRSSPRQTAEGIPAENLSPGALRR